jgi:16S rRNA C967 or C1407 C5-methylase (RsmB/RsmF family)
MGHFSMPNSEPETTPPCDETLVDDGRSRSFYADIVKENPKFERYLRNLIPEDQVEPILDIFKNPLPVTFRFLGNFNLDFVTEELKSHKVEISRVPFCPNAWQLSIGRKDLRKNEEYSKFHKWLVDCCENGYAIRQEAVSMIPPLVLDVQPGHKVLDMCAAPGSKTSQLIEAIGSTENSSVVANDVNRNRGFMLYHQVRRMCSPHLLVTQFDASSFPKELGPFDRVLCDVPCSGDGTLRKNISIWKTWNPRDALGLHSLQRRIFQRGIDLLKPNGLIVYSTCSLNPVENEAVVASILLANPILELIDCKDRLDSLVSTPGLCSWSIPSPDGGSHFDSFDSIPEELKHKYKRSMFPEFTSSELRVDLSKCIRIYPHLQDTGGFFVALFRKKNSEDKISPKVSNFQPSTKKFKSGEEPLLQIEPSLQKDLFNWFFQQPPAGSFVSRSSTYKTVNCIDESIYSFLSLLNSSRVINAGITVFEKYTGYCPPDTLPYRITSESLRIFESFIKKELIRSYDDQKFLLELIETELGLQLPADLKDLPLGSVILKHSTSKIHIPVWNSGTKIKSYIPKLERPLYINQIKGLY